MNYDEMSHEELVELLKSTRANVRRYAHLRANPAGPFYFPQTMKDFEGKIVRVVMVLSGGKELDVAIDADMLDQGKELFD